LNKMTQHTPGPWNIRETETHVTVIGADNEVLFHDDKRIPRVIADARLIAAAPELLAALEGMEKWASSIHDGYPPSTASIAAAPYREAARAAIAKATGEQA
jgi:hypothetical protein